MSLRKMTLTNNPDRHIYLHAKRRNAINIEMISLLSAIVSDHLLTIFSIYNFRSTCSVWNRRFCVSCWHRLNSYSPSGTILDMNWKCVICLSDMQLFWSYLSQMRPTKQCSKMDIWIHDSYYKLLINSK